MTEKRATPTPDRLPANVSRDALTGQFRSRRAAGETLDYDAEGGESLDRMDAEAGIDSEPAAPAPEALPASPESPTTVVVEGTPIVTEGADGDVLIPAEMNEPAPAPAPAPEVAEFTTVKINGRTVDALTEDVDNAGGVAAYQIVKTAEERLENAKQVERQNIALNQELQQRLQASHSPDPAQQTTVPDEAEIADIADDLLYGDEAAKKAAVAKLAGVGQQTTVNPGEIEGMVQRTVAKQTAIEQFKTDFPEIWADDDFMEIVYRKDDEYRIANPHEPFAERYARIGAEVREKLQGQAGSNQPTHETLEQRQQRKARASTPTSASPGGGGRPVNAPRPPSEKERHQRGLDQMRKARNM